MYWTNGFPDITPDISESGPFEHYIRELFIYMVKIEKIGRNLYFWYFKASNCSLFRIFCFFRMCDIIEIYKNLSPYTTAEIRYYNEAIKNNKKLPKISAIASNLKISVDTQ